MAVLAGKVAVITGGTRGLGLAIARAYAAEGAAVVVASRSQKSVDAAVSLLKAGGARASGLAIDVSDLAKVEALAKHAVQTFGRIDIWVNNAGIAGPYGPTLGFSPEVFNQVIQTNIVGVYNGSRTALKIFMGQKSGKLINVLGHGYNGPVPWQNAYASSKAWIRSFTMGLAKEIAEAKELAEAKETAGSGVGVFAFNPGMVLTDLLTDVDVITGHEERLRRFPTIVRMWAKPPEVPAKKAVWLAGPATDGKTGLLVSLFSPWLMLTGALKVLFKLTPPVTIKTRSIPAYKK